MPEPKHANTKEVGRVLVPHSLSKKPAPKPANTQQGLKRKLNHSQTGELNKKLPVGDVDSDEEDTGGSFFSFGGDDSVASASPMETQPAYSAAPKPQVQKQSSDDSSEHRPSLRGPWLGIAQPASSLLSGPLASTHTASHVTPPGPVLKASVQSEQSEEAASGSEDVSEMESGPMYSGSDEYPQVGLCKSFSRV